MQNVNAEQREIELLEAKAHNELKATRSDSLQKKDETDKIAMNTNCLMYLEKENNNNKQLN